MIESKFDGVRSMVTLHDGALTIRSRRGHDVTVCYPEVAEIPPALVDRSAVFDGEIIAVNDRGLCDFQRLRPSTSAVRSARDSTERAWRMVAGKS